MSPSWSALTEVERDGAKRRFALALAAEVLTDPEVPPAGSRPPRFDELYAAAADPASALDPRLAASLAADAGRHSAFEDLLRSNAVCWFPAAAAAGAGLDSREEDGFRVWLRPSSAGAGQIYVLVRLAEGRTAPVSVLVALAPGAPPARAVLPEDIDGIYQLVEPGDSALVRAVRDPAAKLALV